MRRFLGRFMSASGASATAPIRLSAPPATVAQIMFRNVSSTTCALKGFARLRLRDASGRRLPTRVKNSTYPPHPAVLTPRASAGIELEWPIPTHSCHAPRAASVDNTLPGQTQAFTLPVGSLNHQFAPCNGIVRADAIG